MSKTMVGIKRFILPSNDFDFFFQIYKNLYGAMLQTPGVVERPEWWTEWLDKPNKINSKL